MWSPWYGRARARGNRSHALPGDGVERALRGRGVGQRELEEAASREQLERRGLHADALCEEQSLLDLRTRRFDVAEVRLDDRVDRERKRSLADLAVAHARVLAFARMVERSRPVARQELEAREREEHERQRVLVAAVQRPRMQRGP